MRNNNVDSPKNQPKRVQDGITFTYKQKLSTEIMNHYNQYSFEFY
jgi:hypothetical protein